MMKEKGNFPKRALLEAIKRFYKKRLISVCLFGSVARGTDTPESDIDIFIVAEKLPKSRMKRSSQFIKGVEEKIKVPPEREISAIIRLPEEVEKSPILLDMVEDALILYDRDGFMKRKLNDLKKRLNKLGAKRIWEGNMWYWDLNPAYKPGEVFEI